MIDWAQILAAERPRLFAIAYRMLGSAAGAEDALQEAFLRVREVHEVNSPPAYLTTVTTRLCLDTLQSARARRELYVGTWLPEPVSDMALADQTLAASESARLAFLLVLERLSPAERAAFLLRDVFDYEFSEIAAAIDKTPEACRQLHHRARAHVDAGRPRFHAEAAESDALVVSFFSAIAAGDVPALERLLATGVTALTDGGGEVKAARNIIHGPNHVARYLIGSAQKFLPDGNARMDPTQRINGLPAIIIWHEEHIDTVLAIEHSASAVERVYLVRAPSKLAWLQKQLTPDA